jgi:hypothetical protein
MLSNFGPYEIIYMKMHVVLTATMIKLFGNFRALSLLSVWLVDW